jgi:hypothetical protein
MTKGRLTRPGDTQSQRIRVVCKNCNNGWMSRLQQESKPLLVPFFEGRWPDIHRKTQGTLAAWATMFTMVLEFADTTTRFTTQEERTSFFKTKQSPTNWFVYVGRFEGHFWRGVFSHFACGTVDSSRDDPTATLLSIVNSQSISFVMGSLFIFVCSSHDRREIRRMSTFHRGRSVRRIWPFRETIVKSPSRGLDDFDADEINAALQPTPANHGRRAWDAPST